MAGIGGVVNYRPRTLRFTAGSQCSDEEQEKKAFEKKSRKFLITICGDLFWVLSGNFLAMPLVKYHELN